MLTLFASQGSVATAAHVALIETDLPFKVTWVSIDKGEQRQAEFLAINPKGRLPALATDHGILTETPAILDYISDKTGQLMPNDPYQKARAREMISFLASTAHVHHAHGPRAARWSDDPAAQASMAAKVTQNMALCCDFIEGCLPDTGWLTGGYSIADIHLYSVSRWLAKDGVDITNYSKLSAHYVAMQARPAVATVAKAHA